MKYSIDMNEKKKKRGRSSSNKDIRIIVDSAIKRKIKSSLSKASSDRKKTKIESETEEEFLVPIFVTCCYKKYGDVRGKKCLNCMNLVYKVCGLENKNIQQRLRRYIIFGFLSFYLFGLAFGVISTLYVNGWNLLDQNLIQSAVACVMFFVLFLAFIFFPKYEFVISSITIISAYIIGDFFCYSFEGILDGAMILGTTMPLFLSIFMFSGLYVQFFWFFIWLVNLVVMITYEFLTFDQKFDSLLQKFNEDSQYAKERSVIILLVSLLPIIVASLAFLIKTDSLLKYERRINDKHKLIIEKYSKVANEIDILFAEKAAGFAQLKVNKALFTININEIDIIEEIAAGSSNTSRIYRIMWRGKVAAFKVFRIVKDIDTAQEDYEDFEREVAIISSVKHPNLIGFYGCTIKSPRLGIVMEYCVNGNVQKYFKKMTMKIVPPMPFLDKIRLLRNVCAAMDYLHSNDILHRDLKPQNVLLTKEVEPRIIDFGLSKISKRNEKKSSKIGTYIYMAPEVLGGNRYTNKCDIYSFSIMMFELLTENFKPFGSIDKEDKTCIDPSYRPVLPDQFALDDYAWYVALMKSSWDADYKKRPTFLILLTEFDKFIHKKKELCK